MSESTGPILAMGAITYANAVVIHDRDPAASSRILVATGFAAGAFYLFEKAAGRVAVVLAWTALVAVLLTRVDPNTPAPVESLLAWYNKEG